MKKSQLETLIREALSEVLNEGAAYKIKFKNGKEEVKNFSSSEEAKQFAKNGNTNIASVTLAENGIQEMAGGIKFKLTDDYEDKIAELPYANSEKRMRWINGIIEYVDEVGAASTTTIAQEKFGVPQPRIADYVRDMIRLGILEPEQEGITPKFMRQNDDEDGDDARDEPEFMDPEGGIAGDMSDEEVDAGFPNMMGAEDEPEIGGDIEKIDKPSTSLSPDEVKILLLHGDLLKSIAAIKSDLNKGSRNRNVGGIAGDISGDRGMTDLVNLRRLKAKKEQQLNDLVADNPWLSRFVVNDNPKNNLPEELDEWTKNKLKYYAGIIK
jgi:hypothetical protein